MQTPPYNPMHINTHGLGYSRFARRYLGNRKNLLPERNGTFAPPFRICFPNWCKSIRSERKFRICFLFLQVLKCFTSLGKLPHTRNPANDRRVSPFGNFRVKGYLAPHRILSQPYHVLHRFLKPRHPPYTLRSCKERCTPLYIILCVVQRYILWTLSWASKRGESYIVILTQWRFGAAFLGCYSGVLLLLDS